MMTKHKRLLAPLLLLLSPALAPAAMWWDVTTFTINGGPVMTENHTNNAVWPNGPSNFFQTVGTGSLIQGSLTGVGGVTGATIPAGANSTIDFEISATGGNLDFQLGTHNNNPDRFYALNVNPDASVTSIDYKFTYQQPIQGFDTGSGAVVGTFVDVDNPATLTQSVSDENLNPLVVNDGDVWRNANVGSGATGYDMIVPSTFNAAGTTASIGINSTQRRAITWVREDTIGTADQNVGQIFGSLTGDAGLPLGAGSSFRFTFNGDWSDSIGLEVGVPEPSRSLLFSLSGLALILRRRR